MKNVLFVFVMIALLAGSLGCDRTQQALDAVDKAKSLKDDIEKKAKEVKEKAQGIIPTKEANDEGENGKKGQDKDQKGGKKENKKENDD